MSDSPRWHLDGLPGTTGIVEVMLYADHVAAVAAAEQRVMKSATDRDPDFTTSGYLRGKRDGRREGVDSARDAVAALPWKVAISFGPIDCNQSCEHGPCSCSGVMRPEAWTTGPDDALAAIDALLKEKP